MHFTPTSGSLPVPGAQLFYEVCGQGPILLLIHGGGGDASSFTRMASLLADHYTVVTYDRRGLSRSKLDDPEEQQRVETHSDDAHRLLAALTSEPAYVFGSSGGAVVGLDLAARYPEQVHTLVAHEPPSHLLPEDEGRHDDAREVYQREGAVAALQSFVARMGVGANLDDQEPDNQGPERRKRSMENTVFLLEHEFAMYDHYWLDFVALKQAATQARIIIAAGVAQREYYPYRSATAVANQIGIPVVEFPGGHGGYWTHPHAFAERLHEVLSESSLN